MRACTASVAVAIGLIAPVPQLLAQGNTRYVEENGVTYRETTRNEQYPVASYELQEQTKTVYSERYVTELQDQYRTVYMPVTEYRVEPRVHNWWNPFQSPHIAYHYRPAVRWETRVERTQVPVTRRTMVPETQVVRVPVRKLGWENRTVTDRVAVRTTAPSRATIAARPTSPEPKLAPAYGGIRQIENDPPRFGVPPVNVGSPIRR